MQIRTDAMACFDSETMKLLGTWQEFLDEECVHSSVQKTAGRHGSHLCPEGFLKQLSLLDKPKAAVHVAEVSCKCERRKG
jgi:hypothetical protein